jgi:hypothetical protein
MPAETARPCAAAPASCWTFRDFVAEYAVAVVAAVLTLYVFFPGSEFLPVPYNHDDFHAFSGCPGPGDCPSEQNTAGGLSGFVAKLRCHILGPRPVSCNVIWGLGRLGETPYYVGLLLTVALLPLLAVHLVLGLFRYRPEPWIVVALTAGVTCGFFLFEQSPFFYRLGGMYTNLTSLLLGFLAIHCFRRYFDGSRPAYTAGAVLFLAAAFSKEDILLFVPLAVTADWWVRRRESAEWMPLAKLVQALVPMFIAVVLLVAWNRYVVHSPFTNGTSEDYKLNLGPRHLAVQFWHYVTATRSARIMFGALLAASLLGVLRGRGRWASLAMLPLVASLIGPFCVLPFSHFSEYYSVSWLSLVLAFSLVGIGVNCQCWLPRRLSALAWIAPILVLLVLIVGGISSATARHDLAGWLNEQQENSRYVIEQLVRRKGEFATADTVVIRGVDEGLSPWVRCDGRYLNAKLGRPIRWLVVAHPGSQLDHWMSRFPVQSGSVAMVYEADLAQFPGAAVLEFDRDFNLTTRSPGRLAAVPAAPSRH